MKIAKQVTNNELARMISQGFAGVDERFETMEKRINKRFDLVDARFDKIEKIVLS